MQYTVPSRWYLVLLGALWVALAIPGAAAAQNVTGQARAVQTTLVGALGTTTRVLADTGTLGDPGDARQASQLTGNVPSLLRAGVLHATTISWADQVDSEASLADLALTVAGVSIGADFVMSRARAVLGQAAASDVAVEGLVINGLPISVAGNPNETILIPGGRVVINEQQGSSAGTVVNALHVIVNGIADVIVGSATAGVR